MRQWANHRAAGLLAVVCGLQGAVVAGEATMLPALPEGKSWKLVWGDEFTGKTLDAKKWQAMEGPRRGHWWRAKSAFLDGKGHVVLRTEKVGERYASPCIRTKGLYEKAFGFFAVRCKLPSQPGHWCAFWTMCDGVTKIGDSGRDGTEIDIFEWPWRDGRVQHTLHWDGYGKAHKSKGHVSKPKGVNDGAWHQFAISWTPKEYRFYVDGALTWRTSAGGVCQVPVYLKLSSEIGSWAGDIRKAKLPDDFTVDWVRVYDIK